MENIDLKLKGELPITRKELIELISSWGRLSGIQTNDRIKIHECKSKECYDLSNLDVSQITNLSEIFNYSPYNGDLSKWDVSNCINIDSMFYKSEFNNDSLKDWNTSNIINMDYLFYLSNFNGDISNWNVKNVTKMKSLFDSCPFDGDISSWKFNSNVYCYEIFCDNTNFKNKYNSGNEILDNTKYFIEWFEENREKMREMNIPKEEVLDFFSFDSNIEKEIIL